MRKVKAFIFITLDGYYAGEEGDISWHNHGHEENEYASRSMSAGDILLFGRVTYDMMQSYWPTPMAKMNDPVVAEGMNKSEKLVFSRTLKKTSWENSTLVKEDVVEELKRLKLQPGKDMTLLGSGSILKQLAEHGLIDEYQIMVDPVVIGSGVRLFEGIREQLNLKLVSTTAFKSGVVLLCYQP
ncbi:MAG: dihydrofolate reductase family protein [Paludibacter sp.]|nr:dihydrofolate reductase family protein [Paludibacter sp.]